MIAVWAIIFYTNALLTTFAFALNYYFVIGTNGPSTYQFGYDTPQENGAPRLMREEGRMADGTVIGRYGYTDPFGVFRVVKYAAGPNGYYAFEDVGGASSSVPLFFKATASQRESTSVEQEKSIPHLIATKFDPPLYHPGAHLAETPKLPDLDDDFRKLVFNAQFSSHSHSPQFLNTTKSNLNEESDRKAFEEISIRRSTVSDRDAAIEFDDDIVVKPKVFRNQRDGDVLKELESIRINAKPKQVIASSTRKPTYQRTSWILPLKQTTFRPQLSRDQQLIVKNKDKEERNKIAFKPEPHANEQRFNRFELTKVQYQAPTSLITQYSSSTTKEEETTSAKSVLRDAATTTETIKESLVFSDFSSFQSNITHQNASETLSSSASQSSSFGDRLNSEENIQSLKSIFSSFLKRKSDEKQLKEPLIRHRAIKLNNESDFITVLPSKQQPESQLLRFMRKQGSRQNVKEEMETTTQTEETSTMQPSTIQSMLYYSDAIELNAPLPPQRANYPLNSYLTSSTQADFYPVYRQTTEDYSKIETTSYKEMEESPKPIYKPAFPFADVLASNAHKSNDSIEERRKSNDQESIATPVSDNSEEESSKLSVEDTNETILLTNATNATSEEKKQIASINDWSTRETNPITSDIDFYDDDKIGIESPEGENNNKKKIIKVWFRKGDVLYLGPQTSEQPFERKPKIIKFNANDFNRTASEKQRLTNGEMTASKKQLKTIINRSKEETNRNDHLEPMQNNLKHGTLYVPPIGLLSLTAVSAGNDAAVGDEYETRSATNKVNFYIPPIPVIRNAFNLRHILEPETKRR